MPLQRRYYTMALFPIFILLLLPLNRLVNSSVTGWEKIGTVDQIENIIQQMGDSFFEYEFGIIWNGAFDSVDKISLIGWNQGLRICTVNNYPMGDDSKALKFGRTILTKGLSNNPTADNWYRYYYYMENDEDQGSIGVANSAQLFTKKGNPWFEIGILKDIETLTSSYPLFKYEIGIVFNGAFNSVDKISINYWNKGLRVSTVNDYPMGDDSKALKFGKAVFTKGLNDNPTTDNWYHHYYYMENDQYLTSNGIANSVKLYARLLDDEYTDIGTTSLITSLMNIYLPYQYEFGIIYLGALGSIDSISLNGWNTGTRLSTVNNYPMGDIATELKFGKVVLTKDLDSAPTKTDWYRHYYYMENDQCLDNGIVLANNNRLFAKRRNPWIYVGTLNELEQLVNKYKFYNYEYGITWNGAFESVDKIVVNYWNEGLRVSTINNYPMGDDATKLKFGKLVLTKGLDSNPTKTDWYRYYYYMENDEDSKSHTVVVNNVKLYIRAIEKDAYGEYIGCNADPNNDALSIGPYHSNNNFYNVYQCHLKCINYKYFAIKNGGEYCSCDDDFNSENVGDDDLLCNVPTITARVGGVGTNSVYQNRFEAVTVTIKSCNGYQSDGDFMENTFKMQLKGENAVSKFLWVNKAPNSALPQNGNYLQYGGNGNSNFYIPQNFGGLYSIGISFEDSNINNYCIDEFNVTISDKVYDFGYEYFGNGIFLSSQCNAAYLETPSLLDSNKYISCLTGTLQLNTYSMRSVFNLDIHSCIGTESGMTAGNMKNTLYAAITGKKNERHGYISEIIYLDTMNDWLFDTIREYELNIDSYMDEIIVISITNDNKNDNICIDDVSVSGISALHLSDNDIGGSTLNAIFEFPVCKTEVVGLRIDYSSSKAQILKGDSSIVGLECSNYNRLVSSTCSISQSYELSKTTSYSISNENTKTKEYSWGSESSISYGTSSSQSIATSDEFSWGLLQEVSVGAEVEVGAIFATASVSVDVSIGANQQWTSSREHTSETSSSTDISNSQNEQNTFGSESTKGFEASYETSSTSNIECSAEFELPPSHTISYNLIFNAFNTTIKTFTDLKLTLCSVFADPKNSNDDSHYVYIDDIPGIIQHKETTSCNVEFSPIKYVRNDVKCEDERQLSISILSDYLPRCKSDGTYDGCQCDKDKTMCWCVDPDGNKYNDETMEIEQGMLWQEVCLNKLKCNNFSIDSDNLLSPLEDDMDCVTAQKLAIYNDDSYLPRCRSDGTYDGCQCNTRNKNAESRCWCSTEDGNNINGKAMEVEDGMTYQQVCVQILQCQDSDIIYNGEIIISNPPNEFIKININNIYQLLIIVSSLIIIALLLYKKCCNKKNNHQYQSSKVKFYDIESSQELNEDEDLLGFSK